MDRVTIGELARRLGLSQSAVSYALNGERGVSEATRARVVALADELGWRPSSAARSLRSNRSRAVGMVVAREAKQLASESFYLQVLAGLETVLAPRNYSLLLRITGLGDADLEVYRGWAMQRQVDGVVLFDLVQNDPRLSLLTELGLPMVLVGAHPEDPDVLNVAGREDEDARLIVELLDRLGHRHVGFVGGPGHLMHEQAREAMLTKMMRLTGTSLVVQRAEYSMDAGRRAAARLLSEHSDVTAVIGSSDLTALGVLQACRGVGLNVPGDVSVISWDDSIPTAVVSPSLTALQRDPAGMGAAAARLLLDHLENVRPPTSTAIVPTRLVERESTGPVRSSSVTLL